MNPTMIIADDHPILRQAVARGIAKRAGFEVVECVGDVESAVESCMRLRPDVLLLDLEMPGGDPLTAVEHVRQAVPGCKVVIFTAHSSDEFVKLALSAHPEGYLLKDDAPDVLVAALRGLMQTGNAFSDRVRDQIEVKH